MSVEDDYRRRAEALLRLAAAADNMKQRGDLIDQALHFHNLAMDAHAHGGALGHDDDDSIKRQGQEQA